MLVLPAAHGCRQDFYRGLYDLMDLANHVPLFSEATYGLYYRNPLLGKNLPRNLNEGLANLLFDRADALASLSLVKLS